MKFSRAIGVDDGHFTRGDRDVPIAAVLMRDDVVERVYLRSVSVDGTDATDVLVSLLLSDAQARVLFLNGIALGGTNVVDLQRVHEETGVVALSLTRKKPSPAFLTALDKSPRAEEKKRILERAGDVFTVDTPRGVLYARCAGADKSTASFLVRRFQINALLPEPLRLAHLVATAVTLGDSRGGA